MKKRRVPKRRNPVASALKSPLFKPKVKPSKKIYSRKKPTEPL